jgi:hypothetical protein
MAPFESVQSIVYPVFLVYLKMLFWRRGKLARVTSRVCQLIFGLVSVKMLLVRYRQFASEDKLHVHVFPAS